MNVPRHFSSLARRSSDPPISWLMKTALERPHLISLAAGFTDNATLPVAEVSAILRELLRHPSAARAALQYGTTAGSVALRAELARRCRQQDCRGNISAADIIITNGSQQLLYILSEILGDTGDIVLVEDPTYFVYLGIVEAMGLRAFGFHGVAALAARLEWLKRRGWLPRLKLLYLVTYFRNPTGHTWSLDEKREALAIVRHYERAAGHPIYLLEDAAYRDLRFAGNDVPSFRSLDAHRVLYTNTLTKPFATGLKLGYGVLPPPVMRHALRAKGNHDFGSANFLQVILARTLADGLYDRHLPVIAAAYRRKRDAMVRALDVHFPSSARYETPGGGLYVWVELEPRIQTGAKSRLFRRALEAGVFYVPGELCYATDPTRPVPRHGMRLSFGASSVAQIGQGVRRLAGAIAARG
jgi:2-aminoadipate transaminase